MTVLLVLAFVFGLIYGSFLNVVIWRFGDWSSIVSGRSECPKCKTKLQWYDLVPLASYVMLWGKCRYCKKPISSQYPIVELLTAVLLTVGFRLVFSSAQDLGLQVVAFTALLVAVGAMVTIVFQDLDKLEIADLLSYALIGAAIVYGVAMGYGFNGLFYGLLIGLLPIALLVYPSQGKWMGEGDVKVAAGLGLLTGFPNAIVFMAVAFLSGGVYGLISIIFKKANIKSAVPFGPFLVLGALVALFWGGAIINWYVSFITRGF